MSWVHTTHMRGEVEGHVLKIAAGPPDLASARTRNLPLTSVLLQNRRPLRARSTWVRFAFWVCGSALPI